MAAKTSPMIRPQNLPTMLKEYEHWLVWRYEKNDRNPKGKPLKMPYYIDGTIRRGVLGGEEDVARLAPFEEALAVAKKRGYDGVGLAILPEQGITVIDLDNCITPEGEFSEFAQVIVQSGSYVERSPSGRGLRAVYMDQLAPNEKRNFHIDNGERVEIYCGRAYTTFTGNIVIDENDPLERVNKEVTMMPRRMRRILEDGMRIEYGDRRDKNDSPDTGGLVSMNAMPLPNLTAEQAKAVLKKLPERWGQPGEGTWYRVAAAIHMQFGGSEEGWQVLDEWSQNIEGYDEEGNRKRWEAGFSHARGRDDLTTMRNLVFEALGNGCKIRDKTMEAWGLRRPRKSTGVDDDEAEAEQTPWDKFDWAAFAAAEERPAGAAALVRNWFYRKAVTLFSSNGGAGKTYITLTFAALAAIGGKWFDQEMTPGRVLFVGAEDEMDEITHRLWGICQRHNIDRGDLEDKLDIFNLFKVPRKAMYVGDNYGDAEFTKQFDQLKEIILAGNYAYIILDNISKFYMANENARALVDEFISGLATLAGVCDAGVLLLGHDAKATASGGGGYSGSTAWNNSARSRWALSVNAETGVRELAVEKNNYGLTGHGGTWAWNDSVGILDMESTLGASTAIQRDLHLEAVEQEVLALYGAGVWTPATARGSLGAIESSPRVTEMGIDARALRTYLRQLVDDGKLEVETFRDSRHARDRRRYGPPNPID